jgi:hypothetical protein
MNRLATFDNDSWQGALSMPLKQQAITSLEQGRVLFFPQLKFDLLDREECLLSPEYTNKKSKNISYNHLNGDLRGMIGLDENKQRILKTMMQRFATQTRNFIDELFPRYKENLIQARTSFRPVEVAVRVLSYRKDDSRLHVDAFPANPNQGKRILRVFSNINPQDQDRIWRLGEPFERVVAQFMSRLKSGTPGLAKLFNLLGITKSYRTLYDHFMLQLHDAMKADSVYQRQADQMVLCLPAQSSWIVQTDHVSHAAMSGQYVLEQTFYLPVEAMQDERCSPLRVLEKVMGKKLV